MDLSLRNRRLDSARTGLTACGAAGLVIPPSADFRWLTGATARSTERLVALVLPLSGDPFCVVPRLEADALAAECPGLELLIWDEHEDPVARLVDRLSPRPDDSLLLGEGFRLQPILTLASRARCDLASRALGPLRAVKDAGELSALERAAAHADQVVLETAETMRPGMSEREVARFACQRFRDLGDTEPWAIVASGPNSAQPHHFPSERELGEDQVVLIDLGAFTNGYGSDITRTFWLGSPPPEAEKVFETVDRARAAGVAAARVGAAAEDVDRAARVVIEAQGYGEFFTHRTGHGVGLEIHEPPYLVRGNRELLRAGMVHSIEPGIYLPGRFGIRLEDLVVVEPGGGRRLNQIPCDPTPARTRAPR